MKWTARLYAAAGLVLLGTGAAQASGSLILRGGAIYTLDPAHPWAHALVIEDGRIAYVGSDAGALSFRHPGSRVIALQGHMVLPGFHDAHTHPMSAGMRLLRCPLYKLGAARIYGAIRSCAASDTTHAWLLGEGWPPLAFGPGGPSRAALDALLPDRPAFLRNEDASLAWVNSKALALAGIDLEGGGHAIAGLVRDPKTGRPSGLVTGEAYNLIRRQIPPPTQAEYREALRRTTSMANRFGITSLFDADANAAVVDAYHAADLAGELTVRVVAAQHIDLKRGAEQVDEMVARRGGGRRFRADAAKFFLDGEISEHTAAMLEPYADAPGLRGELFIEPGALNALVRRLDAESFLIHMHAMGDRAVRAGLDAIALAVQANGPRDRRHQLAHLGVVDPSDIARFAALGVTANFSPMWFQAADPAWAATVTALGPSRARWIMPMASIAAAGARVVASSDWPSTSMNPLDAIEVAVTRQPLGAATPSSQPQERIALAAILAAYTRDAAFVVREDALDGTLASGKAADLIVLDRNLFRVKPRSLHKAHVLLTLVDGEPVWRDPRLEWR